MLAWGAKLDLQDNNGHTPLELAAKLFDQNKEKEKSDDIIKD